MNIPPITWFSSITDIYTRVDIFPIDMRCLLCKSCRSIVTEPCKFCSKDRVKKKKEEKNDRTSEKNWFHLRDGTRDIDLPARLNSKRIKKYVYDDWVSIWIESGQLEKVHVHSRVYIYRRWICADRRLRLVHIYY